ncbi:MAG: hypothetical protein QOE54_7483 [Streptosporangiaceae bacterium]|jgi:hypothetical protein|nr:hypothetical protein [Streptosporangiaceae bacterium]
MEPLSREQLLALPVTTTIEMAARALCIGRTRAYELARRDEFPCKVIRIGTSYRVITADLHRLAGIHQPTPNPAQTEGSARSEAYRPGP